MIGRRNEERRSDAKSRGLSESQTHRSLLRTSNPRP
jgi:hypothetical protein